MATYTLTFGDQGENHVGMQKIGVGAQSGFTIAELETAKKLFDAKGYKCELLNLNKLAPKHKTEEASILVVRNGLQCILDKTGTPKDFFAEQSSLDMDKKAYMRGKVVNKKARYNLCFDTESQEPDYENKKGRIVAFKDVNLLNTVKKTLPTYFGEKTNHLIAEGNYYYDPKSCYIGFHGDSERVIVVGIRVGKDFPLHYQWYQKGEMIGQRLEINLGDGDIYAMSAKAVGTDWKKRLVPTLRHAAGFANVLKLTDEHYQIPEEK
jgi:hypothetical protein